MLNKNISLFMLTKSGTAFSQILDTFFAPLLFQSVSVLESVHAKASVKMHLTPYIISSFTSDPVSAFDLDIHNYPLQSHYTSVVKMQS